MRLAEVSKDPLTDRVIRAIKDLIWRGDVTPGDYLPRSRNSPLNSAWDCRRSVRRSRRYP